tara:strand:+ start:49 stop:150 length:102 start_codon:yes stop_codon:yes gene_type:complete
MQQQAHSQGAGAEINPAALSHDKLKMIEKLRNN